MTPPHEILRERLRAVMQSQKITAMELARRADVKNSFIYDILNGKSANPSTVRLGQVAGALGVSLAYLAGMTGHVAEGSDTFTAIQAAGGTKADPYRFDKGWISTTLETLPEQLRLLTMQGDSMAPTFLPGDAVLFNAGQTTPSPPGLYIVSDGETLLPRRLEMLAGNKIRVKADNAHYGETRVNARELRVMGRVVWLGRCL